MKMIAVIFVNTAFAACALALSPGFLKTASFIVRAIDEDQQPVTNAIVSVDFYQGYGAGMMRNFEKKEDRTDTNGLCRFKGKCDGDIGWNIGKKGYYTTIGPRLDATNATFTQWLPADKEYEIILRPILNPIPMNAKKTNIQISVFDEPLGYDLEKGNWISPHGNGLTADFIFQVRCVWSGDESPYGEKYYDASVELTFSNEDDGIIEFADSQLPLEGSIFRLPRHAPDIGYTNKWSLRQLMNSEGSHYDSASQREGLNYFFRVRTKKDEAGNIIAANYGKIRKPLQLIVTPGNTWIGMIYYFNPTPNDRNMEFDPSRNLFTDLPVTSQVRDP